MNRNVMLLTQFSQVYLLTNSITGTVTTNSGIRRIVYLEIYYVVPIGHGFSFFGHGRLRNDLYCVEWDVKL